MRHGVKKKDARRFHPLARDESRELMENGLLPRRSFVETENFQGPEEQANFRWPSCNLPFLVGIAAFVTHKIDDSCKALRAGWWILAVIVFSVVITIRTRLLGIPLERDEGEYAYAGQLILQGV